MTSFTDLRLAEPLLKALDEEGYTTPTPIQAQAIPPVMAGNDLLGIAQTGTGKTAAFALPILHRLAADRRPAPRKGCRVLVLSPTRELCSQIGESFRAYGRHMGITVAVVFGGVAHRPQIQTLSRGVDVLVAAPGRLLDLMEQRAADLSGTEIFVLDEADQMLDLGFVKPIRRIVSHLAHKRQNLFFSATMPTEISGLAHELLKQPVKVSVAPVATTAERVRQRVIHIETSKKRTLLAELLADPQMKRTLVFTRTKRGADRVARHLEGGGTKVAAIHGNKSQRQREIALEDFKQSRIDVLVATDIAARGIDIDLVTHVINYELPEVPEAYVHRIGRTARAGASGVAISLCDGEEREKLRAIERLTRQQIPHEDRRNDASIVADRTPSRAGDGERREDGERRSNGHHRNGSSNRSRSGSGDRAHGQQSRHATRTDRAPDARGRDRAPDHKPDRSPDRGPDRSRDRGHEQRPEQHGHDRNDHSRDRSGGQRGRHTEHARGERRAHEPRSASQQRVQHQNGGHHAAAEGESGSAIRNVAFLARPPRPAAPRGNEGRAPLRRGRETV